MQQLLPPNCNASLKKSRICMHYSFALCVCWEAGSHVFSFGRVQWMKQEEQLTLMLRKSCCCNDNGDEDESGDERRSMQVTNGGHLHDLR